MDQTLEELKASNAADEAEDRQAAPVEAEVEEEAEEIESEESSEIAESDQEGTEEVELEAWQLTGEQTPGDNGTFTGSDIAAAKKNLRAKLDRKHETETAGMQAQIDALKSQLVGGQPQQAAPKAPSVMAYPTLEKADYDEALHAHQLQAWTQEQISAGLSAATQTYTRNAGNQQARAVVNSAVDAHYERAAKLDVKPEIYHDADLKVRQMFEAAQPGQGDFVTDQVLSMLGEGSEKVMFFLGRNPAEQNKVQALMSSDPTGLSTALYLGELKARATMPGKRKSKAPKPAAKIQGEANTGASASKFERQYAKAKNVQERMDVRRAASKAGVSTSNW